MKSNQPPVIEGFWRTTARAVVVAVTSFVLALVTLIVIRALRGRSIPDALVEEIFIFASCCFIIAGLFGAIARTGQSIKTYLAFSMPSWTHILFAIAGVAAIGFIEDWSTSAFGLGTEDFEPLASQYQAAATAGALILLYLNAVFVGPLMEEVLFRGFLFHGWSASRLGTQGTIILTSALFGLSHLQYSWYGMLSAALTGLFLGWLRWHSGSIYPAIASHVAINAMALIVVAEAA